MSAASTPSNVSLNALYIEAIELTRRATTPPPPEVNPTETLCHKAKATQDKLYAELRDKLPGIVRGAASHGKTTADLLTFSGNEKYNDDFSYLFLLKGPRDREQKYDLYRHGFMPLFDRLTKDVVPFQLMFTWVPGCNLNKVTLEWSA
jgi:hypothetical protein